MKIGIPWKPSLVSIALREFFDIIERRFYEFRERERESGELRWWETVNEKSDFFLLEEELERVRKRSSCCCSEQSTQICRSGFFIFYFIVVLTMMIMKKIHSSLCTVPSGGENQTHRVSTQSHPMTVYNPT